MEYISVSFDPGDVRTVLGNGNPVGSTDDQTIPIDIGFYTITLSGGGYTPPSWNGNVVGTTPQSPLQIVFTKIAGAGAANA